ncbi:ABC transporter substrate-binding protein [Bradyrhizobium sp. SRL28]|uniref:ABC transporter substrate-binding protein n=1 Tax=Bradyrhizobium sp. SRL28 TaxID=2836178 RepID=UPI001BDF2EC3|nr:ABC transporter substrate-binding protein [Bradyrhizobium sp. SRL28]MBT1515773.1 ABC transporter substrate-binding protein [Bradyrhizobium sp. SRL28]
MLDMKRREFITLLGGAVAWPLAARAQQPAMPVVGFLHGGSAGMRAHFIAAFHQGLKETGHIEGQHIEIDYRWADDQSNLLPALAVDLARRQVSVITTCGGERDVFAAKAATSKIPIVFIVGSDPVKAGFVASLGRPGGNLTGVNMFSVEMQAKRLGILHELIPPTMVIANLVDPNFPPTEAAVAEVETAARIFGRQLLVLKTSSESDIDAAFATIMQVRAGALLVGPGPFFNTRRNQIVALAARHAIPAIYEFRDAAKAGGLVSYGTSLVDAYRLVGVYTGRILKGEKPADLPVVQPTKFELVINLKTAKALGLEVPPSLLAIADEVIE